MEIPNAHLLKEIKTKNRNKITIRQVLYYLRMKTNLYARLFLSAKDSRKGDAFIVVGVSRAGTKMLTRFFINCGCSGNGDGRQLYEYCNPHEKKVVWKTNLPYESSKTGNMRLIYSILRRIGYDVKIIWIRRDDEATITSQMKKGILREQAIKNIKFAKEYLDWFIKGKDFEKVLYEEFCRNINYRKLTIKNCHMKYVELEKYVNQNKK